MSWIWYSHSVTTKVDVGAGVEMMETKGATRPRSTSAAMQ
jgi:hypothetical protein